MTEPKKKKNTAIESRRVPRVAVRCPVRLVVTRKMRSKVGLAGNDPITGMLLDISTLGVGMQISTYLPRGTRINGKFPKKAIAKPSDNTEVPFVATVKNCRNAVGAPGYRVGTEFERITKRNLDLIVAYVKAQLPK